MQESLAGVKKVKRLQEVNRYLECWLTSVIIMVTQYSRKHPIWKIEKKTKYIPDVMFEWINPPIDEQLNLTLWKEKRGEFMY